MNARRLKHLEARLRGMVRLDLQNTDEFRKVWLAVESIKNQNGGLPPKALPQLTPIATKLAVLSYTVWELKILGRLL